MGTIAAPVAATYARAVHASRRWALVVLGTVVLLGAPIAVRALPADEAEVTAAELLAKVQASDEVAYSGYAESTGRLQLPATDEFSELAALLGERSRLRVWWRGTDDWRVDTITTAGETDLFNAGSMTTEWDYEAERATNTGTASIRLPSSSDMLPPELGRLALREARPDEVSRIASARIAGIDAPGLRLVPAEPQSTIDHVDVWVEARTGLPLRVAAYTEGDDTASVTSTFLDVTIATPPAEVTRFLPPPGSTVEFQDVIDVAAAAERFAPVIAPRRLAGLAARQSSLRPAPWASTAAGSPRCSRSRCGSARQIRCTTSWPVPRAWSSTPTARSRCPSVRSSWC